MLKWIFFIILLFFNNCVFAQINLGKPDYISVYQGLSDRTIYDILQDEQGFLWIATSNGLNKYDGRDFLVYTNKKNSKYKIHKDLIRNIHLGKDNKIILEYQNKLESIGILFEGALESKKIPLQNINGQKSIVQDINVSNKKEIFLLTEFNTKNSIIQYEENKNEFITLFDLPKELNQLDSNLRLITDKKDNSFWIRQIDGVVWHFSKTGEVLQKFELPISNIRLTKHPYFSSIFHTSADGEIWASFEDRNGLFHIPKNGDSLQLFQNISEEEHYGHIWEDQKGNIIVANNLEQAVVSSISLISPNKTIREINDLLKHEILITTIYSKDFNKSLIVGSHRSIRIFSIGQNKNIDYILSEKIKENEWGKSIRGITGDGKGNIYIAREVKYIYRYNIISDSTEILNIRNPQTGELLNFRCATNVVLDGDILWASSCKNNSTNNYLIKFNLKTEEQKFYELKSPISCLYKTSDGKIWVGLEERRGIKGELIEFDPESEKQNTFTTLDGNNPFTKSRPCYLYESRAGTLWVGTMNGLFEIDRETKLINTWKVSSGDKNGLSGNYVMVVFEDKDNNLWFGNNGGFNIWNPKTDEMETYSTQDGLPSNEVCGILPDKDSTYWISTFNGLSYFDRKDQSFGRLGWDDGLSHNEFNRFAFFKDENGKFYFGGMNGVNSFYTKDILSKENIPSVSLKKFSKYDSKKDILIEENSGLGELNNILIQANISFFQFDFLLPIYYKAKSNQFSTWLEGYEKEWQYLGNKSSVRYNQLPAGNYTLHIKGADAKGNWSKIDRKINITVQEPIYKSPWFILFVIIGTLLISGLYYRWHIYKLKINNERLENEVKKRTATISEQAEKLKKLDQIKSRIFMVIGHDLKKPAVAFRGITRRVNFLLKKQDFKSLETLGESIEKDALGLNTLIDNILNWALAEKGALPHRPQEIKINELINEVFSTLNSLARNKNIELINHLIEPTFIYADIRAIQTIIRNIVDNAIKYTPENGNIIVSSFMEENKTIIEIKDSGVGIPTNKIDNIFSLDKAKSTQGTDGEKGTGIGLHVVCELVQRNNGNIHIESEEGKGTSFFLTFPKKKIKSLTN